MRKQYFIALIILLFSKFSWAGEEKELRLYFGGVAIHTFETNLEYSSNFMPKKLDRKARMVTTPLMGVDIIEGDINHSFNLLENCYEDLSFVYSYGGRLIKSQNESFEVTFQGVLYIRPTPAFSDYPLVIKIGETDFIPFPALAVSKSFGPVSLSFAFSGISLFRVGVVWP